MVKKIISILLSLLMVSFYTSANGETETSEFGENLDVICERTVYTLSLEDAIQIALENNPLLPTFDAKKKSNEVHLELAKYEHYKSLDNPVIDMTNGWSGYNKVYVLKGYYVKFYESALRLLDKEKEQVTATISYNATDRYFNYQMSQMLIEISENAYNLSLENKAVADERYALGLISELDVNKAQIAVDEAQFNLESNKRNFEIAKEKLKIELQLDEVECDFVLTDGIEYSEFTENVEEDIDNAVNSRYDMTNLREKYELAKLYDEFTTEGMHTPVKANSYSSYIQSEYEYSKASKLTALSIRNSYNNILSAKNNLEIAERNLSIKKREYETDKLKLELGIISNIDVITSLNNMVKCKTDLSAAQLSFKLAVEKYQYEISIGL